MALPPKTVKVKSLSKEAIQYIGHIRQVDPNLYDCLVALIGDANSTGDQVNTLTTILTNAGIGSGGSNGVLKKVSLRI